MLTITGRDLLQLRGAGGERFTLFMNALLRAHCWAQRIPDAAIDTTDTSNLADGKIDARINLGAPHDPTSRCLTPTVWQYKAVDQKTLTPAALKEEVDSTYLQGLLHDGHAYRLCVCDFLITERKETITDNLQQALNPVVPGASQAQVLGAEDLAALANRYPAIILRFFTPELATLATSWNGQDIPIDPPHYIIVPSRETAAAQIRNHVDLAVTPNNVVLTIHGRSGVGKTRFVYESIRAAGSDIPVLYIDDETNAGSVARILHARTDTSAILVVDDCNASTRIQLADLLLPAINRCRVIAINNESTPPRTDDICVLAPVYSLTTEEILQANFPLIPQERRRAYAHLAQGYVRLAVQLCRQDTTIVQNPTFDVASRSLRDLYDRTVTNATDRHVIETLALVPKLLITEDGRERYEALAAISHISPQDLLNGAERLTRTHGYVAKAGRFRYVTPDIIASLAFEDAWTRIASHDPTSFLNTIAQNGELFQDFLRQLDRVGTTTIRAAVATHLTDKVDDLTPTDLGNTSLTSWLMHLLRVDPRAALSRLQTLLAAATDENIQAIPDALTTELIGQLDDLAIFPEHAKDVELVLRRLALSTTGEENDNHVTRTWTAHFAILMSGNAAPFADRLQLLEQLLTTGAHAEQALAIKALKRIFALHETRVLRSPVFGGRIKPQDATPPTWAGVYAAIDDVLLLVEMLLRDHPRHTPALWTIITGHLRELLNAQRLPKLVNLTAVVPPSIETRAALLARIDSFLEHDTAEHSTSYVAQVVAWKHTLSPTTLSERLHTALRLDEWDPNITPLDNKPSLIDPLAHAVFAQPDILTTDQAFLSSSEARSARPLFHALGKLDHAGSLWEALIATALETHNATNLGAYLAGLLTHSSDIARVNKLIDDWEADEPALAFAIMYAEPTLLSATERLIRLTKDGRLPPTALWVLQYGGQMQALSEAEFRTALSTLTQDPTDDNVGLATRLIGYRYHKDRTLADETAETIDAVANLLERAAVTTGHEAYYWRNTVSALITIAPERALCIVIAALRGTEHDKREAARNLIVNLGQKIPQAVMQSIGDALLANKDAFQWLMYPMHGLFAVLPPDVVMAWLHQHNALGARVLARHLPSPTLIDELPIVPPVTQAVLDAFGADDNVYQHFVIGRHPIRMMTGDIAAAYERDAAFAGRFLGHSCSAIHRWAVDERANSSAQARSWRLRDAELDTPT